MAHSTIGIQGDIEMCYHWNFNLFQEQMRKIVFKDHESTMEDKTNGHLPSDISVTLHDTLQKAFRESRPLLFDQQRNISTFSWDEDFSTCHFTDQELIDVASQFYEQVLGIDIFATLTHDYQRFLQFRSLSYTKQDPDFLGITYFNPLDGHNYAHIYRQNTSDDIITTVHEICHMLHQYQPFSSWDEGWYCMREADALFTELLLFDFLIQEKGYPENWKWDMRVDHLYTAMDDTNLTVLHEARCRLQEPTTIEEMKDFLKTWHIPLAMSNEQVASYQALATISELQDAYQYLISYFTALDLYHLYQNDPKTAKNAYSLFSTTTQNNILSFLQQIQVSFPWDGMKHLKQEIKILTK